MASIQGTGGDDVQNGTADRDLIYGGAGDDTQFGGDGNDVLYGGTGDDFLFGGEGDDQLTGGEGADDMTGGNGNDSYFVDNSDDQVRESTGGGNDTIIWGGFTDRPEVTNITLGANVEELRITGSLNLNGKGNELNNSIRGNSGNNSLSGLGGNDNVFGFGGDDVISGGAGNDVLDGGDGIDTLTYKILATNGVTVDLARKGQQNTGQGLDAVNGFENLEGTEFDDVLSGDAGANKISGLGGNDLIRGRAGNDDLTGGSGNDTFRFDSAATNGVDRIRGFTIGSDRLEFHTSDGYAANATLTFGSEAVGSGPQGIYDINTGQLFYDADGDGAGAAILIAQFDRGLNLTGNDISVINDGMPTM